MNNKLLSKADLTAMACDDWYERSKDVLGKNLHSGGIDLVGQIIKNIQFKPQRVLEIGCCNGWRLNNLKKEYGCDVAGIDPSPKAIEAAKLRIGDTVTVGTAQVLPWGDGTFDTVIFAYSLWMIEPSDLFRVAMEADRVLQLGGVLIIQDRYTARGVSVQYGQIETGQTFYTFSCDFPKLWLGHPGYLQMAEIAFKVGTLEVTTAIRKVMAFSQGPPMNVGGVGWQPPAPVVSS